MIGIVLVGENLVEVNNMLNKCWLDLEKKVLRISRSKTEFLGNGFGGRDQKVEETRRTMTIRSYVIGEVEF